MTCTCCLGESGRPLRCCRRCSCNNALQNVASFAAVALTRTTCSLASIFGRKTHLFFVRIDYLLLLRLLDGGVDLGAHRRSLRLHGVARLLQFLLGGRVAGADAQS